MKETTEHIDLAFKKVFEGFEETPPETVKKNVFRKMIIFNNWYTIKRALLFSAIFVSVCGLSYWAVYSNSGKNTDTAMHTTDVANYTYQRQNGSSQTTVVNKSDKHENSPQISNAESLITKGSKPIVKNTKADKTRASQNTKTPQKDITTSNDNTAKTSTTFKPDNSQLKTSTTLNFTSNAILTSTNAFSTENTSKKPLLMNMMKLTTTNDQPEMLQYITAETQKKYKRPLLWSGAVYAAHSVIQPDIIHVAEPIDDAQFKYSSKMNFPSGVIGLSARAEKKHFFFDLGLQYSKFTEKITANHINYNPHNVQKINLTGQTTNIDTTGGYYHYYYIADSVIRILDSVWTWKTDTLFSNIYDTTNKKMYDTLRNAAWKNTYTFIEIPLTIGWQKNFGRINIGFSTGPIISMLITTKGNLPYNIVESPTMIALSNEFKKFRFGMSWQVSGFAGYQFNSRMLIELSPYYRFNVIGIKSSNSGNKLINNSFGIQLGLRYYF